MRNKYILSENEIRNLVKRTLLKEEGENKTISQLQSLLASKGFTEVGTADGKAGPNTLSAINRALNLGLNLYKPQQQTQKTQAAPVVKNPNLSTMNPAQPDGKLAGDNSMTQGVQLNPQNPTAGINVEAPKYTVQDAKKQDAGATNTNNANDKVITDLSSLPGMTAK